MKSILFPLLAALMVATGGVARAQFDSRPDFVYFRYNLPLKLALLYPATGAEAAVVNPARLADAGRGFSLAAFGKGGRGTKIATEVGVRLIPAIYMGLNANIAGSTLPGTNAVFLENMYQTMIAFKCPLDGESGDYWSIGNTFLFHQVNSMALFKVNQSDLGAGFVYHREPGPHRLGAEAGISMLDFFSVDEDIAISIAGEREKTYRLYQWMADASLALTSPDTHWMAHGDLSIFAPNRDAFPEDVPAPKGIGAGPLRLDFRRYGLEYRPWKSISLRVERLWNRYWVAGLGAGHGFAGWSCRLDAELTKGRFQEYYLPDRTGWISSYRLSLAW
ncbi:MAG: hypothetical protein ABI036_21200 [Fibrobacteria bacterium]